MSTLITSIPMSQQPTKWIWIIFSPVLSEFGTFAHHITYGGLIWFFVDCYNCLNEILKSLSYTNTFYHEFYHVTKNMLQILTSFREDFYYCKEIIDTPKNKMRPLVRNYGNVKCFHVNQSLSSGTRSTLGILEITDLEFECVQVMACHVVT